MQCPSSLKTAAKTEMLTPKGEHFLFPPVLPGVMFDGRIIFDGIAIRQKLW